MLRTKGLTITTRSFFHSIVLVVIDRKVLSSLAMGLKRVQDLLYCIMTLVTVAHAIGNYHSINQILTSASRLHVTEFWRMTA